MKYVIKEIGTYGHPSYVGRLQEGSDRFYFVDNLYDAHQFTGIQYAVSSLIARGKGYAPGTKFTIIGIKEVNQPRYEEVVL